MEYVLVEPNEKDEKIDVKIKEEKVDEWNKEEEEKGEWSKEED